MFPNEKQEQQQRIYNISAESSNPENLFNCQTSNDLLSEDKFNYIKTKKKNKFYQKQINAFLLLFIYLTLSSFSFIYIKYKIFNASPFFLGYIQTSVFSIYLPLSLIITIFKTKFFAKAQTEKEQTFIEIQEQTQDNFSDIMTRRYYETYYNYYKSFYINCIILMILYFFYTTFYYQTLREFDALPLANISCFSTLFIFIFKLFIQGKRSSRKNIIVALLNVITTLLFLCFYLFYIYKRLQWTTMIKGMAFSFIYIIMQSAFVLYFKKIIKKYKYYLNITEIAGFVGAFSIVSTIPILLCVNYFQIEKINFDTGIYLYITIFKCGILSLCVDYCYFWILKVFSLSYVTSISNYITGILFMAYVLIVGYTGNGDGTTTTTTNDVLSFLRSKNGYYVCIGVCEGFVLILFIMNTIRKCNESKHKKKRKEYNHSDNDDNSVDDNNNQ